MIMNEEYNRLKSAILIIAFRDYFFLTRSQNLRSMEIYNEDHRLKELKKLKRYFESEECEYMFGIPKNKMLEFVNRIVSNDDFKKRIITVTEEIL